MSYDRNALGNLEIAALTIAGSDSCGGAGIQADLKTFAAFGIYGASAVTALTAQNTLGVSDAYMVEPAMISAQIKRVIDDLNVKAIKTGMLGTAGAIEAVSQGLSDAGTDIPLVMDPVMVATSGSVLASDKAIDAMQLLMQKCALLTPNCIELSTLTGTKISDYSQMHAAGEQLLKSGCAAVLLKGGHLEGNRLMDTLITADQEHTWQHDRLPFEFHGTGCTLSAAITAGLAAGEALVDATANAIEYLQQAMRDGGLPRRGKLVLLNHAWQKSG